MAEKVDNETIGRTLDYLNGTTAGFAYDRHFYLFAGHRVCRMNNETLRSTHNCSLTICEWISGSGGDSKTVLIIAISAAVVVFAIIILVIIAIVILKNSGKSSEPDVEEAEPIASDRWPVEADKTTAKEPQSVSESDHRYYRPTELPVRGQEVTRSMAKPIEIRK
jgi:hypothetical protein